MAMGRKLRRSKDSVVFGVLGGLAEYMDTDPTLVRVIYSMLTVFTAFCGVILYVILWLVMPPAEQ